ncbi:DUF3140 domain-containing protein [Mycobacterium intracellulare]|uniref:DUF3140 domain-containing protein n=1 Tax=Mycobacterium intracellulare TaxID=1767 RepID=UPI003556C019
MGEITSDTEAELEKWLATEESTGHASGGRIVEVLRAKRTDLTEADYARMSKVVAYSKRHVTQRPQGNIDESPWRYSLKNWGHDPEKS